MLRNLLQKLLKAPVTRFAEKISSSPNRKDVFSSLFELLKDINDKKEEKGVVVPFDINAGKFIIFSDQHKGAGDLADDFHRAENNYVSALKFYYEKNFSFINLGDCEELWETTPKIAIEKNRLSLFEEAKFLQTGRYYRIFGNHDLEWKYDIQQSLFLKPIFGDNLKVYEGIVLTTEYNGKIYTIFLTHGHQGDKKSDGNAFSKWVVAAIWTPIQRYLEINIDSISDSYALVDRHNIMMHDWSATQKDIIFISGHTHKPVFASLDHIDRLQKQKKNAEDQKNEAEVQLLQKEIERRQSEYAGKTLPKPSPHPSYFNTGCCCYNDGDITGIEIENGFIRLVKWEDKDQKCVRKLLEESPLYYIFDKMRYEV